MQFIDNGPDIPEELLYLHQQGKVVFFCGAGISVHCFPLFKELVDDLFKQCGTQPNEFEQSLIDKGSYDDALDYLEQRLLGQREQLRLTLFNRLNITSVPNNLATHKALLELSLNSKNTLHLVTTNFDRLFFHAEQQLGHKIPPIRYSQAPTLEIPRESCWNGIAYLHGLLPEQQDLHELNKLVLTSADFGDAYLRTGWATQFVTELLRNFHICFVGYSVSDPVMQYMMKATALAKRQGEDIKNIWAFVGTSKTNQEKRKLLIEQWDKKGITPIIYSSTKNHQLLHNTLKKWATIYSQGLSGISSILNSYAQSPNLSTTSNHIRKQVLWALSEPTGNAAKIFSKMNPVPDIRWLQYLDETRTLSSALPESRTFLECPFFQTHVAKHSITQSGYSELGNFPSTHYLEDWLCRHLNTDFLKNWIIKKGYPLEAEFADKIRKALNSNELNEFDLNFWTLFLEGKIFSETNKDTFAEKDTRIWKNVSKLPYCSNLCKQSFFKILEPKIFYSNGNLNNPDVSIPLLTHCSEQLTQQLREFIRNNSSLNIIDALNSSLLLTIEYFQLLNTRKTLTFPLRIFRPSISDHEQNHIVLETSLGQLISCLRDCWDDLTKINKAKAKLLVQSWKDNNDIIFKRLALYAAKNPKIVLNRSWIFWLKQELNNSQYFLSAKREICQLILARGHSLSSADQQKLENAFQQLHKLLPDTSSIFISKLAQIKPLCTNDCRNILRKLKLSVTSDINEFSLYLSRPQYLPETKCSPKDLPESIEDVAKLLSKNKSLDSFDFISFWSSICKQKWTLCFQYLKNQHSSDITLWNILIENSTKETDLDLLPVLSKQTALLEDPDSSVPHFIFRCLREHPANTPNLVELAFMCSLRFTHEDSSYSLNEAINTPSGIVVTSILETITESCELFKTFKLDFIHLIQHSVSQNSQSNSLIFGYYLLKIFNLDSETFYQLRDLYNQTKLLDVLWNGIALNGRIPNKVFKALHFVFDFYFDKRKKLDLDLDSDMIRALTLSAVLDDDNQPLLQNYFQRLSKNEIKTVINTLADLTESPDEADKIYQMRIHPFWIRIFPQKKSLQSSETNSALIRMILNLNRSFELAYEDIQYWLMPLDASLWKVMFQDKYEQLSVDQKLKEKFKSKVCSPSD